jgi:hypothetical protein
MKSRDGAENYIRRSCVICNLRQVKLVMKSRRMRSAVHVARMGEKKNFYSLLVGKPEGKGY